jgi:predicted chitinase/LysM repeat protein
VTDSGAQGLDLSKKSNATFNDWDKNYSADIQSLFNYICRPLFSMEDIKDKNVTVKPEEIEDKNTAGQYTTYKVKAGDTLSAIAEKYDTTVEELARLNNIKNVNLISVGQVLKVPFPGKDVKTPDNNAALPEEDNTDSVSAKGSVTVALMQKIFKEAKHFQANSITEDMVDEFNCIIQKYGITTKEQIECFLAVTLHESRLALTEAGWCSKEYVKDYCERYEPETERGKSLGNTKDGDGYLFRGAGYIQLTGKSNYQSFANAMDDPEIMKQGADYVAKKYSWEAAGYWWKENGINKIIENGIKKGQDPLTTFKQVSNAVNRGPGKAYTEKDPNGWDERKGMYEIVCSKI